MTISSVLSFTFNENNDHLLIVEFVLWKLLLLCSFCFCVGSINYRTRVAVFN